MAPSSGSRAFTSSQNILARCYKLNVEVRPYLPSIRSSAAFSISCISGLMIPPKRSQKDCGLSCSNEERRQLRTLSYLDSAKARSRARIFLCGLLIAFTYTGCTTLFPTPPDPSVSSTAPSTSTVPTVCPQPGIVDAHSLAKTNNDKAMQPLKRQLHDRKRRIVDGLKSSVAGIVIVRVKPGSVAEESGVREGDIVLEVNGQAVTSAKAFEQIADKVPKDQAALLLLKRKGRTMYLTLRP